MNASTLSEILNCRQKTCNLFDTAGMIEALHEDGFALIPSVLSASEVDEAREALYRLQHFGLDGSSWSELNHHFKCVFNRVRLRRRNLERFVVATQGGEIIQEVQKIVRSNMSERWYIIFNKFSCRMFLIHQI